MVAQAGLRRQSPNWRIGDASVGGVGGLGEIAAMIGKKATLTTPEGLKIPVRVLDVRSTYGRQEVLVEPVTGTGKAWVGVKRVNLSG